METCPIFITLFVFILLYLRRKFFQNISWWSLRANQPKEDWRKLYSHVSAKSFDARKLRKDSSKKVVIEPLRNRGQGELPPYLSDSSKISKTPLKRISPPRLLVSLKRRRKCFMLDLLRNELLLLRSLRTSLLKISSIQVT